MRACLTLKPRRAGLPSLVPALRRSRGKASEFLDEAGPLVDRSREAAAAMTGVVDGVVDWGGARRSRRRRNGMIAVILLLTAAVVALWMLWHRRDDEYARLVNEPDRPDRTPTPMPEPPAANDDSPGYVSPPPLSVVLSRAPMTASIPASAMPPTMVETVRAELEPALADPPAPPVTEELAQAPVAEQPAVEQVEAPSVTEVPAFTMPPRTELDTEVATPAVASEPVAPVEVEDVASVDLEVLDIAAPHDPAPETAPTEPVVPVGEIVAGAPTAEEIVEELVAEELVSEVPVIEEPVLYEPVIDEVIVESPIIEEEAPEESVGPPVWLAPAAEERVLTELTEETSSFEPPVGEISGRASEEVVTATADPEEEVEEIVAESPVEEVATEVDSFVEPEAVAEMTEDVSSAADRLNQVLLASEPVASPEVVADLETNEAQISPAETLEVWTRADETPEVEAAETPGFTPFTTDAVASEPPTGEPVEQDEAEVEESAEFAEPVTGSIPPWPGTAEAEEEWSPLTASDAPSALPSPSEADRNPPRQRTHPSRSGLPTNPAGAPFRSVGDQLPGTRSWPTLPR